MEKSARLRNLLIAVWLDKELMTKDEIVKSALNYSKANHIIISEANKKPITEESLKNFLDIFIGGVGKRKKYIWHHFVEINEHNGKYGLRSIEGEKSQVESNNLSDAKKTYYKLMLKAYQKDYYYYSDLFPELDMGNEGDKAYKMEPIIGEINDFCLEHELPLISSICITKQTKRPGKGFFDYANKKGLTKVTINSSEAEQNNFLNEEQKKVWAVKDWPEFM